MGEHFKRVSDPVPLAREQRHLMFYLHLFSRRGVGIRKKVVFPNAFSENDLASSARYRNPCQ